MGVIELNVFVIVKVENEVIGIGFVDEVGKFVIMIVK